MLDTLKVLDGYKMYIGLSVGACIVLINHFVVPVAGINLDPNDWLADLYGLALIATGRSAIKKVGP